MTTTKDKRIVYKSQRIELEGNVITFDGKGNKETGELRVYRLHGDIRLFVQALQDFCLDNGYTSYKTV